MSEDKKVINEFNTYSQHLVKVLSEAAGEESPARLIKVLSVFKENRSALAKNGITVDSIYQMDRTPLMIATIKKRPTNVKLLLWAEADSTYRNEEGLCARDITIEKSFSDINKFLLEAEEKTIFANNAEKIRLSSILKQKVMDL